jgi:hypothetical protein
MDTFEIIKIAWLYSNHVLEDEIKIAKKMSSRVFGFLETFVQESTIWLKAI